MPSVLLCAMPADGHVRPMAAIARTLVERGWRVRFITGARHERSVSLTGAEFIPLPQEVVELATLETDRSKRGLAAINIGLEQAFFAPAAACWRTLEQALDDEPADAVLHETTFVGAAGLQSIPRERRPLVVMCGIVPLGISSRDTAPFGLGVMPLPGTPLGRAMGPLAEPVGRMRNAFLMWLATKVVLRPAHRAAERTLTGIGGPSLHGGFFLDALRYADVLAQFSVPEFEYPRSDAPDTLRYFGPAAHLVASGTPMPDWWSEVDRSRPIVHVTQGTVANSDWSELVGPALEGLADAPVSVVVSTGGRPLASLPRLPANAVAAEHLPYDTLFAQTDVLVTNGGYGGLHFAMEWGVPMVVAGDTEDKVETSARVQWSGVGVNLRTGRPSARAVRAGVERVLADPRYAARSARVGRAIRSSAGIDGFAEHIEAKLVERQAI